MRKSRLYEASKTSPTADQEMPNWGAVLPVRKNILPTDIPTQDLSVPEIGASANGASEGQTFKSSNTFNNVEGAGVSSRVGPSAGETLGAGYEGQGK